MTTKTTSKIDELRAMFLASDRGRAQYQKNAIQLQEMALVARAKGGLYRGRTADQWQAKADEYALMAKGINPNEARK
jgi:hypothetical protein